MSNKYCIIMAGGFSTHFWPVAREEKPKQFLDFPGIEGTFIQNTYRRCLRVVPKQNVIVIGHQRHEALIKQQLPDLPEENLLLEPYSRNTAPCIAYATYFILKRDPEAAVLVTPSDLVVRDVDAYVTKISRSFNYDCEHDVLLTLGVVPTRPDPSFGYIQIAGGKQAEEDKHKPIKVKTFTEKPDVEIARTHTFAPDCGFRVNGRVCETEIDGSGGTPVCLATVSVPVVPQDEPLELLRRPDQRVYDPGEHFNPAGLEIGFLTDGVRTPVSDLTFDSEPIQENQEAVRVQWDGMYVDVPIIAAQGSPFADVAAGCYAYDPAIWAHHDGIASGVSAGLFAPDRTCTRGQMVTFLWRFAGCPKPTGSENPFTDVRPGSYYSDAVRWAVEQGISTGTGSGSFSPEKTCTRGQMVTFLWRFSGRPVPTSSESPFTDVRPGSYCSEAVRWAVKQGITTGVDPSHFGPERSCTRGHAVTFLYRM